MDLVTVTNRNEEPFAKKFDGQIYEFLPSQPVTISERAAGWLFGYGKTDEDRNRCLVQNGWVRLGHQDREKAQAFLRNFVFNTVVERKSDEEKKPVVKLARVMTGVNAMSPPKEDGTVIKREHIKLPGSTGPLAPPVKATA